MQLTTEDLGEIAVVKADELSRILDDDAFGGFVVLAASEHSYIQAANNWAAGKDCEAFIERHGSDPWILEYRDEASKKQFQANRDVTLAEVKEAFLVYLRGGFEWRTRFQWNEIDV